MHRSAAMSLTPKINLSVRHVTPMGADFSLPRGRFAICFPFLMEANPLALGFTATLRAWASQTHPPAP